MGLLDRFPEETTVGNHFISNYPPFSTWTETQIPELVSVLEEAPAASDLCLYVHLPFCARRCNYCYYRVHTCNRASDVDSYIDAVLAEASLYRERPALRDRRLLSVYFGGGSPSFLAEAQLRRLFEGLRQRFDWCAVDECTFECEPAMATLRKLRTLRALGVTRLSLGFQSLDADVLAASGRLSDPQDCHRAFELAREAGFDGINIDLLAGLPTETRQSWIETVDQVTRLEPECVTIYQLELSYNSILYARSRLGAKPQLASWPEKRQWVRRAFARFEQAGYTIIGGYMALRDPARWRFRYTVEGIWRGMDLLALGESAFGHIRGVHYQNADSLEGYCEPLSQGRLPLRRARKLRGEERLRREIILQLKTGALDARYFREKFGVDLPSDFHGEIQALRARGLAEADGDAIQLTRDGLLLVDWLLPLFYLPEHRGIRYT
jgi:oxygen-independent coproporphyrinogen-3 oxidase